MLRVVVLILMMGLVSAVDVEWDCPDEIYAGEEFECEVEAEDGDAEYDLKVEADSKRDSVLRIWDSDEGWKSGYFYLNDFVRDDEDVKLKILEEGRYDLVVKLRDGDWREEFDVGRLKVLASRKVEDVPREENYSEEENVIALNEEILPISLNSVVEAEDEEEWDYVSKDGLVVDWLPYAFCLFLIFVIGILFWERF